MSNARVRYWNGAPISAGMRRATTINGNLHVLWRWQIARSGEAVYVS